MVTGNTINLHTVLTTYLRIAGFTSICDDGLTAFEHALDKHRAQPGASISIAIVQLRDQYWCSKLGGCSSGSAVPHKCEECGRMKLAVGRMPGVENGDSQKQQRQRSEYRRHVQHYPRTDNSYRPREKSEGKWYGYSNNQTWFMKSNN